jgi:hypothetical protein
LILFYSTDPASQNWNVVLSTSHNMILRREKTSSIVNSSPDVSDVEMDDIQESQERILITLDEDDPPLVQRQNLRQVQRSGNLTSCNAIFIDGDWDDDNWERPPVCECRPYPYDVLGNVSLVLNFVSFPFENNIFHFYRQI